MGNNCKTRKGQITFFIITGLVMVMIFITLFILISRTTEEERKREAEKVRQLPAEIAALKNFAQSCVELTAENGILLLGKQGWRLFDLQGGPIPLGDAGKDYLYVPEEQAYVAYSIKQFESGLGTAFPIKLPEYPYEGFPLLAGQYFLGGLFGYVDLPALEDPTDSARNITIKGQLKYYIENNLKECTKGFVNFPNLDVKEEDITANITFTGSLTYIDVNYPLDVRKKATNELIHLEDFFVNFQINMKDIYYFTRSLLHSETIDISHKMRGKEQGSIKVKDINKDISGGFDDIVVIEDTSSLLNGVPFSLNILIVNRPPALHYIDQFSLPLLKSSYKIRGDEENILIVEDECGDRKFDFNESIRSLSPILEHKQYYDPDDDIITVSYIESLPDLIEDVEAPPYTNKKYLTVNVSDGEYSDSQTVIFNIADWGTESPACVPVGIQPPVINLAKPWNMYTDSEATVMVPNVKIEWTAVPMAAGYKIFEDGVEIATTANISYIHESGSYDTHYYTIKSFNATDESLPSGEVPVTLICSLIEGTSSSNGLDEDCDGEVDELRFEGAFGSKTFDNWNIGDTCKSLMSGKGYTATCKGDDCGSINSDASFEQPCRVNSFWIGVMPLVYYGGDTWQGWSEVRMQANSVGSQILKTKSDLIAVGCQPTNPIPGRTVVWDPESARVVCWKYEGKPIYD